MTYNEKFGEVNTDDCHLECDNV